MITKEQSSELKKVLGKFYTAEIAALLDKREVVNKSGVPYDNTTITHVMNGNRSNPDIESAIFDTYKLRLQQKQDRDAFLGISA